MKTIISIKLTNETKTALLVRPESSQYIRPGDLIVVKYNRNATPFSTQVVKTWTDYANNAKHIECTYVRTSTPG